MDRPNLDASAPPRPDRPPAAAPSPTGPTPGSFRKRRRATANAIAQLDLRTRDALILRRTIADLTAHVGGRPSETQKRLIERAAWLTLWCARLDDRVAGGGELTDHDHRRYLGFNNALTRTLKLIGLQAAPDKPPTLTEHLARQGKRIAGAAA